MVLGYTIHLYKGEATNRTLSNQGDLCRKTISAMILPVWQGIH